VRACCTAWRGRSSSAGAASAAAAIAPDPPCARLLRLERPVGRRGVRRARSPGLASQRNPVDDHRVLAVEVEHADLEKGAVGGRAGQYAQLLVRPSTLYWLYCSLRCADKTSNTPAKRVTSTLEGPNLAASRPVRRSVVASSEAAGSHRWRPRTHLIDHPAVAEEALNPYELRDSLAVAVAAVVVVGFEPTVVLPTQAFESRDRMAKAA
jgi:hypothetical protein